MHGPKTKDPPTMRRRSLAINDDGVPPHLQGMRSKMKAPSRRFHHVRHQYTPLPHHRAAVVGGNIFHDVGHALSSAAQGVGKAAINVGSTLAKGEQAVGKLVGKEITAIPGGIVKGVTDLGESTIGVAKGLVSGEQAAGKDIGKFFEHPSLRNMGDTLKGVGEAAVAPVTAGVREGGAGVQFLQHVPGVREANLLLMMDQPEIGVAESGLQIASDLSRKEWGKSLSTAGYAVAGLGLAKGVGALRGAVG